MCGHLHDSSVCHISLTYLHWLLLKVTNPKVYKNIRIGKKLTKCWIFMFLYCSSNALSPQQFCESVGYLRRWKTSSVVKFTPDFVKISQLFRTLEWNTFTTKWFFWKPCLLLLYEETWPKNSVITSKDSKCFVIYKKIYWNFQENNICLFWKLYKMHKNSLRKKNQKFPC
jgi:hypothetical protein